jgi:hypothetical protein
MSDFLKQRHCPSSELLSALAASRSLSPPLSERVGSHLHSCEFCAAEFTFLKKAAPADDKPAQVEIPLTLRIFAANLLAKLQMPAYS